MESYLIINNNTWFEYGIYDGEDELEAWNAMLEDINEEPDNEVPPHISFITIS